MNQMRKLAAAGLKPGQVFTYSRTFSQAETNVFGDLTRDYNPVHYEERFTRGKGMGGLICHGLLVGSMICEAGGQMAWLASGMDFKFLAPVFFGDTVTCTITITSIDERHKAEAEAVFTNQRGEVVITAKLSGVLPNPEERALLARMMEEGDPTNKLA